MSKIIVITPDDEIKSYNFTDTTISEIVDGIPARIGSTALKLYATGELLPISLFCNDDFMNEEEGFDKINAVASTMCNNEIRGNLAIVVDVTEHFGEISHRGFEYIEREVDGTPEEDICEHWLAVDTLMFFIKHNKEIIRELHNKYDGHYGEKPQLRVVEI